MLGFIKAPLWDQLLSYYTLMIFDDIICNIAIGVDDSTLHSKNS